MLPSDGICFNYLGQLDNALPADSLFAPAAESDRTVCQSERGPATSVGNHHLCAQFKTAHRMAIHRAYHRTETVERLVSEYLAGLRELVVQCEAPEANSLTLTDFPLAGVDEADLDA